MCQSPAQQNGWHCGYYTMLNMYELAKLAVKEDFADVPLDLNQVLGKDSYSDEDVMSLREFWCDGYIKYDMVDY